MFETARRWMLCCWRLVDRRCIRRASRRSASRSSPSTSRRSANRRRMSRRSRRDATRIARRRAGFMFVQSRRGAHWLLPDGSCRTIRSLGQLARGVRSRRGVYRCGTSARREKMNDPSAGAQAIAIPYRRSEPDSARSSGDDDVADSNLVVAYERSPQGAPCGDHRSITIESSPYDRTFFSLTVDAEHVNEQLALPFELDRSTLRIKRMTRGVRIGTRCELLAFELAASTMAPAANIDGHAARRTARQRNWRRQLLASTGRIVPDVTIGVSPPGWSTGRPPTRNSSRWPTSDQSRQGHARWKALCCWFL